MTLRVGIVDTTFARVDMAKYAIEELRNNEPSIIIERITVPGFKNTPWAAKQLINRGVDAVMVFGWIGPSLTDKITYAVASMGLILLQIEYDKPIIDVTVHEDEASDEKELFNIAVDRSRKHARNLILMLRGELTRWAGMGLRQGRPDVGPILQ
ncbi:MAG: riboflavin synthase [Vulcanisaeta sp.]|nr:riboflavin synthase [Vulcanisaeta sp.]MCG2891982.1 riboflavin synthase [Vulcanisaeta sp.]MCG2895122.1 riboflavin synthase [Vulcanisaeta sp.]